MTTERRPRALVTGASSGIGRAFAEELARRGNDLVVVARREDRLDSLAEELSDERGVEVEVLVADLTTDEGIAAVAARLTAEDPIDLLVNNAGLGGSGAFATSPSSRQLEQVDLNVRALVALSHASASAMVERRRGGILNVGSVAGFQPLPGEAVYAATKAFVLTFTEGLYEELRGTGVKVTVLCPGFTHSEFHARAGTEGRRLPRFLWQGAEEVAVAGLDALEAGKAVCVSGLHNKVLGVVTGVTPRSLLRSGAGVVLRAFG